MRAHSFDPDRFSRTAALISLESALALVDGVPEATGRSMATCAACGAGERYRAHQPAWWRFLHPVTPWRVPPPESGRWLGWRSPLPPVWLWHAVFDGSPLCRCAHSAEYRDIGRLLLRGDVPDD